MAIESRLTGILSDAAREAGVDLFGATSAESLPASGSYVHAQPGDLLPGARSVAIAGYCTLYEPRVLPSEPGKPRGRFTSYGSRVFEQMESHCMNVLSRVIRGKGYSAADAPTIPMKPAVVRSGLGKYGKHSVVVTPSFGSMVMFACVATDAPLDASEADMRETECPEKCTLCIDACPTAAIAEPYTVDKARCMTEWLWGSYAPPELRAHQGDRLFGCAECLFACPKNRGVARRASYPVAMDAVDDSPELIPLLTGDLAYYRSVIPTFPMRAGIDAIRGNAIIALGNIGDPAAVEGLGATLGHKKARLRAYSAWALARIGTRKARALVEEARKGETDPMAASEMEAALG
jgi:epoxyqueuosine reductase